MLQVLYYIINNRRLYDEAMTKGYVETSVTKGLIVGAAGVGKTHLNLQKDPPEQRVSTGLADNPVRAISFTLAGVGGQEEDDWFVVEDDQTLMSFVGQTVRDGVSMVTSLDAVVSTLPKITINNVPMDGASVGHPDPMPADITMDTTTQQSRTVAIEDELIHTSTILQVRDGCKLRKILYPSPSVERRKLFGVKLIQFIVNTCKPMCHTYTIHACTHTHMHTHTHAHTHTHTHMHIRTYTKPCIGEIKERLGTKVTSLA